MSGHVWVSKAIPDPDLERRLTNDLAQRDVEAAIRADRANKNGESVPQGMCPKRLWSTEVPDKYYSHVAGPIPNLFFAGTHWIVSAKAAEIIGRFDLGGGALYPVSEGVFEYDNLKRIPGEYFSWIFGNVKEKFLPDETPKKRRLGPTSWWHMPWEMEDGDIAVSRTALAGPDVWVDTALFQSIFLSGPLGDALDEAGLRHDFRLFRCKVV